jgi:TonB family protein
VSNLYSLLMVAAWKGTLVLGAAWILALLLRRRSAAARHLVWTAAAAALLALPFLTMGLPSLSVKAPVAMLDPGLIFRVSTVSHEAQHAAANAVAAAGGVARSTPFDPRPWIVWIWAAGAALGFGRLLAAWISLARARRSARVLEDSGIPVLDAGPERMPLAFGIFRPVIFLPSESAEWSEERRSIVVRHEAAHVERGDLATHLLARLALVLHWWNPLAWIAWREFLKERERAADDLVLTAGARASDYAAHLLEIARTMQVPDRQASAAIAMARPSQLEGRLRAILDSNVDRRGVWRMAPVVATAAAVILIAPLAAVRAQQAADPAVRFRDQVSDAGSLVKQGDLAVQNHQKAEAEQYYAKAVSMGDSPIVAAALMFLGHTAEELNNFSAAEGFYQRAFHADPSGKHAGAAIHWLVEVKQKQGAAPSEIEAIYKSALAVQAPTSSAAATTMQLYAGFLRDQNRNAEADQYTERANAVYRARIEELTRNSQKTAEVHRVGQGGVTAPRLLAKVEPSYSEEARAAKFAGTVLVYAEIGPDGLAHNISVKKPLGMGLDEEAIEAIEQWKFQPGTIDGQPVTVAATIEVNFRLM